MEPFDLAKHTHRRLNILTGEYVLVSPHRDQRPWKGQTEKIAQYQRPEFDPTCYLCPGNTRANGEKNPPYTSTYVFLNDFAAIRNDTPQGQIHDGLLQAGAEQGICKVICFSPRHYLTLPDMNVADIKKVVDVWIKEYEELGALDYINHVQIFENKGEVMGCSNPHPHGQIWAQRTIPNEVQKKQKHQLDYWQQKSLGLLQDYLTQELTAGTRIIAENNHMVALVPFWAVWPFEVMIAPKRKMASINEMDEDHRNAFAELLKKITRIYDQLFQVSFPYSAGIHQAPTDGQSHPEWHWHMGFYPPLLRSATVKKFMVGYEMFAQPQRDFTPEWAAQVMRGILEGK
jgi:UDPglucose--hexose-1-phosphate uridylyltransferase